MAVSNKQRLHLLLWKNWRLQMNRKLVKCFEYLCPVIFLFLLVALRIAVKPRKIQMQIHESFDLHLENNRTSILTNSLRGIGAKLQNENIDQILAKIVENHKNNTKTKQIKFDYSLQEVPGEFNFLLERILQYPIPLIGLSNYQRDDRFVSYLTKGFTPLQNAIALSYLKSAEKNLSLPNISMQRYPYPEYIYDPFNIVSEALLSTVILVCFVYPWVTIVKYIATEKEMHLKEYMKILDVSYWIHWLALFINSFFSLGVIAVIITIFLKIKLLGNGILNHSSWSAVLAFLLVYIIVSIFFCFMLAIFFTNPSTAAASSGLIWFLSSMPYSFLYAAESLPSNKLVAVWCLSSNTALRFAIKFISDAEGRSEGLQWKHFFTFESDDENFPFAGIIMIMLLSSLLYLLICLYVEQIYPGDLCVGKKWYFPFTKSFWISQHNHKQQITDNNVVDAIKQDDESSTFEMEPEGRKAVIQLRDLKKKFNKKFVVHGISLNMYEDDITVLLGQSGCGKSVLISMITGMCTPTSGTAFINGFDIQTKTKAARSSMCYCPQRNVLFPRLTVYDHLYFFGSLKGLQSDELRKEIERYLKITDLDSKRNVYAEQLSDGMNRKLSVAIALCGGTKVIICDEPSSGMDPAARIKLWDLLLNEKYGRTIVLTTHYMDEADILGNRIAVISEGKVACCGTPIFLKKKYCCGYRLICAKSENTDTAKVTALLEQYIPSIKPDRELGSELSYVLPVNTSSLFEKILIDFEENSNELQLNGYGLSCPTMEDVFMQINPDSSDNFKFPLKDNKLVSSLFGTNSKMLTGYALMKSQWNGLLRKKMLYSWRNKFMLLTNTFMSVVYYAIFSILVSRHWNKKPHSGPLFVDLTAYPKGYLILEKMNNIKKGSLEEKIANQYEKLVNLYPKQYKLLKTNTDQSFTDYLMSSKLMQSQIDRNYLAGATIGNGTINAWFSNKNTAPLSLNLVHRAMAKAILGNSSDIRVLNDDQQSVQTIPRLNQLYLSNNLGEILGINLGICMCFASAYYIMFVIRERESRFKLLQFLTGIGIWTFWLTHLFWDFVTFSITAFLVTITLACFQEEGLSTFVELGRLFLLLLLFSLSVLPFTYAFSWLAKDSAVGFARLTIINIFMGVGLLLLTERLHTIGSHKLANAFSYFGMMCPIYSLSCCINLLYYNRMKDLDCPTIWKQFGDKTELMCAEVPICCENSKLLAWKSPGLLSYITALVLVGAVSLMILIGLHYHLISWLKEKLYRKNQLLLPDENDIDYDVIKEKEKVRQMTPQIRKTHTLVVDRLTKYFGNFVAVNQISFCVAKLECFGLLGVNGAGKTTTFKMLTGDESISYGWIYIKGISVISDSKKFRQEFSFCPQRNALLEEFTGTETLQIFCYLYGIPKSKIQNYSNDLAKLFELDKHISKQMSKYSGGNKRKLSFAVAMIGNPSVIYLDEPTCDMDPASRRQIWKILSHLREAGKSLVLASHSMEECETLCTRLTIMVQGEFVCLGSVQHLKDKFNNGWILKIKISSKSQVENNFIKDEAIPREKNKYNSSNPSTTSHSNFIWQTSEINEPMTFNVEIHLQADNAKRSREIWRRGESYQKQKRGNYRQRTVDAFNQSGSQNLITPFERFQIPSSSYQTNVNGNYLLKENSRKLFLPELHQQQKQKRSNQANNMHHCCQLHHAADRNTPCVHYHWNRCHHCGHLLTPTTQNKFNGQYYAYNWERKNIMQQNLLPSAQTDIANPMQNLYSIPRESSDRCSEVEQIPPVVNLNQTSDEESDVSSKCCQLDMYGQSGKSFQNISFQTEHQQSKAYESECESNHQDLNEEQSESGQNSCQKISFQTEHELLITDESVCDSTLHTILDEKHLGSGYNPYQNNLFQTENQPPLKTDPCELALNVAPVQKLYDTSSVEAFIESAFDGATKERSYQNTHVFHIPARMKLSAIVGLMEEYKKFLNIENYSVSQTTLEEIFVNFSKKQNNSLNISQSSQTLFSTSL